MSALARTASPALDWSGNGQWLATVDAGGLVRVHAYLGERVEPNLDLRLELHVDLPLEAVALSHDGRWLAALGADRLLLWGLAFHGTRLRAHLLSQGRLRLPQASALASREPDIALAFAPDTRSLAVGHGRNVTLLRLDAGVLKQPIDVSVLAIRSQGSATREFIVETPAGRLVTREAAPRDIDADDVLGSLRGHSDLETASLDSALAPWRSRLLPFGLGSSQVMSATEGALVLDVEPALARYPWELLLVGSDTEPLGCTQGLVRHVRQDVRLGAADASASANAPEEAQTPLHALLIEGTPPDQGNSVSDFNADQLSVIAAAIFKSGPLQGRVARSLGSDARAAVDQLFSQPWRLLVLLGDADAQGWLRLADGQSLLGAEEVRAMRRLPDIVLCLGDDFRALAPRLREIGVAVVVASGWVVDSDGLRAFFSEWLRALRQGEPLVRATRMARQQVWQQAAGTAWALEVHGDPLWIWPQLPEWIPPESDSRTDTLSATNEPAALDSSVTQPEPDPPAAPGHTVPKRIKRSTKRAPVDLRARSKAGSP